MYGFIEKWAQQQYFSGFFNSGSELNKYRLYSQEEKKGNMKHFHIFQVKQLNMK